MTNAQTTPEAQKIAAALQYLAGVCDYANEQDGVGYNGSDTVFGHSLAEKSMVYPLTENQLTAGLKMLKKYTKQLAGAGLDLPATIGAAQPRHTTPAAVVAVTPEKPDASAAAPVSLKLEKGRIAVRFLYDPKLVEKIKSLSERKFNGDKYDDKHWTVPTRLADDVLALFPGAMVDPAITALVNGQQERAEMSNRASSDFDVPGLRLPLLPFQRAGVEFIEKAGGRALLADEMGLGKTPQSLAYLQLHPELRPALIVVPASLKINWQREAARFLSTPETIATLSGKTCDEAQLSGASLIIINYDILAGWVDCLLKIKPVVMICDEAHYVKHGSKTQRGKAVIALSKKISRTILLTGTPVTNRPLELYPLLNILDGKAWGNFMSFANRYTNATHNGFGWDFSGASNLPELHEKIKPWTVRRTKAQVLTELPAKRRVTLPLEFTASEKRAYLNAYETARAEIAASGNQAEQLTIIEKLKQAAVSAKMKQALAWIADFLESGEKLIVFATHKFVVSELMEAFPGAVKVTGDSTQKDRQEAVDKFQMDENTRLFIGNVQAAGVGLTLTAASNVAFLEFPWQPGELMQAEDRAHRIGQADSVTCWYLIATGTIDETIVRLLEDKAAVVDAVTDGKEVSDFSLLGELVNELRSE